MAASGSGSNAAAGASGSSTNNNNSGSGGNAAAGAAAQSSYQLYRRSSAGMALTDALDELIESGHITPQLARKVVEEVRSVRPSQSDRVALRCSGWI